jgi:GNAT superfamily N-acetyltransferase
MSSDFIVRRATVADATVIARHRAEMFRDMGELPGDLYAALVADAARRLEILVASGEYVGWLAAAATAPHVAIAGAGVHRRRALPLPIVEAGRTVVAAGEQGLIVNVFTERAWRRKGVARLLMQHVIAWAAETGLDSLVLHASDEGRALYEALGFVATNEMRYAGDLSRPAPNPLPPS